MSDYPKRLYLGPYRTAVTVETAAEEAAQRASYPHDAPPAPEPPQPAAATPHPKPAKKVTRR